MFTKKQKIALLFLVITFSLSIIATIYGWDNDYAWYDIVLHLSGGLFMAMFLYDYFSSAIMGTNWFKKMLLIVGYTLIIGVLWEFAEFLAGKYLSDPIYNKWHFRTYFIGNLQDTLYDLLNDIIGGLAFAITYRRKI
ncbi:MAG: hypothetical protein UT53_C0031G0002 [Candidatus Yanofskybacteria bacterium GW2011_GWD2_39_48]|uniref:Uncharacterized protein n=1 Tax=Candidatus Yanofskybacteria bacterium GW2011_GWD2_39_48 TaxID=1619031 RepID=A0A0G0P3K0_9BACT|nr:MAG: hypothetical protein UT53_C0031G0002 [Candidatus Yanofskybacteria bacterium GW2011_GWD2_39_48]